MEMKTLALLVTFIALVNRITSTSGNESDAAEIDDKMFKHLCNFDTNDDIVDDEDFCNCDIMSSVLIGRPTLKIDCTLSDRVTNLTNENFMAQKLPVNTVSLILSYQQFDEVPDFDGSLTELDLSNNQIKIIKNLNFIHVKALERLDLSDNLISEIEPNAFSLLTLLHHLDLSSNQLVVVPANVFAPLVTLETLKLSNNEGFGRLMGKDVVNSSLTEIYLQLGVTPHLKNLEMERCNLTRINLQHGVGLMSLNLAFNDIVDVSKLPLPQHLKRLEISGNPIRSFTAHSLSHFYNMTELVMEDMPFLSDIGEYSLYGLPNLKLLSLEGSKNLSSFNHFAFGVNVVVNETDLALRVLNLRGCNLHTLNSSLLTIFENLEELHLDGNPFHCDCEVHWVKNLEMETNLECYRPKEFEGKLLSEIDENELNCTKMRVFMKKLVNSLILLVLLIACSLAIWYFFRQLNPTNRRKQFQKVGPESPYQRVTIEPNRAEYSLQ